MNPLRPASPEARLRNLENRPLVAAIFIAALALFLAGITGSAYAYADPLFVVGFFGTELQVTAFLVFVTAWLLPARPIGLRLPRPASVWRVAPLATLAVAVLGAWWFTRQSLPAGVMRDAAYPWMVLRTTALVGINEEWIFRGFLLAGFCRWWGLTRGAIIALACFGAFHLLNMAAGVPLQLGAVQVVSTILLGSVFLMAAIDTRSLVWPMTVHALYDFAVIDMNALGQLGASRIPLMIAAVVGALLGLISLARIARLKGGAPYDG